MIPDRRGGKLDPEGGYAARLVDLAKFESLSKVVVLPVFLTLTVDRSRFADPEAGYDAAMPKLSELLSERIGADLWGRVAEVQADSGDGWIHWHVLLDVGGTRFDLSAAMGRAYVDLKSLRAEIMTWWCGVWNLGGVGGQDVQLVKKRQAVAGYLSKYVVKPWPAIPPWVLRRKMLRTVGFSRAANEHFRKSGLVKERASEHDDDEDEDQSEAPKQRRPVQPLGERLAGSGLSCKVVNERGYLGQIPCRLCDVLLRKGHGVAVGFVVKTFKRFSGTAKKSRFVIRGVTKEVFERLSRWSVFSGVAKELSDLYQARLNALHNGWDEMQSLRNLSW